MRNVFSMCATAAFVVACSQSATGPSGPVSVLLIQPTAASCVHTIAPATLTTIDDIGTMTGKLGRVVESDSTLDNESQVSDPNLFHPVPVSFYESKGVYYPSNYHALYAASLYYAIETGYLLHKRLDPAADALVFSPNFASRTTIVQNAKSTENGKTVEGNAAYIPIFSGATDALPLNFFLSFPDEGDEKMPLGLNVGVIVHEYTHLVFEHLFRVPEERGKATRLDQAATGISANTLGSLDEGLADYFGYVASKDPHFFLCTFPSENRDLGVPKYYTADVARRMQTDSFDIHEGGAIFAAVNYEISTSIGADVNGQVLLKLMQTLANCVSFRSQAVTLRDIAACQVQAAGSNSGVTQQIWNKYLGAGG